MESVLWKPFKSCCFNWCTMFLDDMWPSMKSTKSGSCDVSTIFDPSHVIKLMRTSRKTFGWLESHLKWRRTRDQVGSYIKVVRYSVKGRCPRLATSFKPFTLTGKRKKWKLLATQTLSRSVYALEFCKTELAFPQFQGSEATKEFIRCVFPTSSLKQGSGSGFVIIWVAGSRYTFKLRIQIRIQEDKNGPQK